MDFATTFGIFLASLFVLSLVTYKVIQFLSSGTAAPQIRRKPYSAQVRSYKDDILMESSEIRYSSKEIEPAKPGEDLMDIIQGYEEVQNGDGNREEKAVKEPLEKTVVKEKKGQKPDPVEEFLEDIFGDEETEETEEENQSRENLELEDPSWHLTESVEDDPIEELANTDRDMSPGRYPECFGTDIQFKRCGKDCGVAKDCSKAIQLLESI